MMRMVCKGRNDRMDTPLMEMQALYQAYVDKALKLEQERQPGQGLLGFGAKPADDPCHEIFVQQMKETASAFARQGLPSQDVQAMIGFMLHAPHMYREPQSVYWTLVAAQAAALPLIERIGKEDAARLQQKFARDFRPWQRLPVQKEVFRALEKRKKG